MTMEHKFIYVRQTIQHYFKKHRHNYPQCYTAAITGEPQSNFTSLCLILLVLVGNATPDIAMSRYRRIVDEGHRYVCCKTKCEGILAHVSGNQNIRTCYHPEQCSVQ